MLPNRADTVRVMKLVRTTDRVRVSTGFESELDLAGASEPAVPSRAWFQRDSGMIDHLGDPGRVPSRGQTGSELSTYS